MKRILAITAVAIFLASPLGAYAQVQNVPPVNLTQNPTGNTPFGAFRILQCDGPAKLNDASTHQIKDASGNWITDPDWRPDPNFIPCDFRGLMIQVQFLINAAIVIGVLAALIGFAYAGFLYITGTKGNIEKAHKIFPKIFWGFILMLTAWFIVYQILKWLTPEGSAYLQ